MSDAQMRTISLEVTASGRRSKRGANIAIIRFGRAVSIFAGPACLSTTGRRDETLGAADRGSTVSRTEMSFEWNVKESEVSRFV